MELHGKQLRLMSGFGQGFGFDGVAIALIAQLNPVGTAIVAFIFAVLRKGASTLQTGMQVPTSVVDIIQALVIIFAVAGTALLKLPAIRQYLNNLKSRKEETQLMDAFLNVNFLIELLLSTIRMATPILLVALAETYSERAGLVNIGLDGIMSFGALVGFLIGFRTGSPVMGILAGALSGIAINMIYAFCTIHLCAPQIGLWYGH